MTWPSAIYAAALLHIPSVALGAVRADLATAGRVEVAAGIAPTTPTSTPEPAASIELRPAAGGRLSSVNWTWTTTYQQRWFLRQPNISDSFRPTLLHQVASVLQSQYTPRLSQQSSLRMTAGSLDYSMVSAVLATNTNAPTGQTQLVRQLAIAPRIVTASADSGLTYQVSHRSVFTTGVTFYRQQPYGVSQVIGRTTTVTGRARYSYAWTARTTQGISFSSSRNAVRPVQIPRPQNDSQPGAALPPAVRIYYSNTIQTDFAHQFGPRTSGTLATGVAVYSSESNDTRWFPSTQLGVVHSMGRDGRRLTLSGTTGLSTFVDPLTGNLRNTVLLTGLATKQLVRYWTLSASATSSIPASSQPVYPGIGEMSANATITLSRQLRDYGQFDIGTRYMSMMTHPNDTPFKIMYQQVWAFTGLSLWLDTHPSQPGQWALQ